jgi:DNA repair exonuclease SbcCD ATPase subunit
MPDNEKNDATVDIDTSGPGAEVELENDSKETETPEVEEKDISEDKTFENEREVKLEEKKEEPKEAEEKKDKELENYSKDVQRRIAKLTGKWREAERQKEEALYYARAQIKAKEAVEAKISKYEPEFFKNAEDSITSGLQAAQAKLAAAREANDLTAESEALTAISELGYKKAKLQETKVAQEDYNQQRQVKQPEINLARQQAPQVDAGPDPKAEEWASKNAWFGQDTAMTYTAFDLHKKLTEEEGYDPQSDEYYREIDRRIRLDFPHKFDTNKSDKGEVSAKPVQTVASAKRSTNTGRRTVTLTPSQVAIAKKLGVPLKEYAKQLKITKEV